MDSEAAFWKAKYIEQLMLHTQVIMMLANPGGLGAALTQAGLQKPAAGQPAASNGAVSPATVQKWGGDLKGTLRKPVPQPGDPLPGDYYTPDPVPMSQRPWPDQTGVQVQDAPQRTTVDGDAE